MTAPVEGTSPWERELDALTQSPEAAWLERGRALTLQGALDAALAVYTQAANRFPASLDVHLGMAGIYWQRGEHTQAETILRGWLAAHPDNEPASFLLVQLLREAGRLQAAAEVMHQLFAHGAHDEDTVIRAVEMLDDYGRPQDAALICEAAIQGASLDPRLHAYAGMLAIQLGQFERARERYTYALAHHPDAVNWNIPLGLSGLQRYTDAHHPDLSFFRELLERPGLDERTRTTTLFALGKAYDDLGEFALAAETLKQANAAAHTRSPWSRKLWKRGIEARLAAPLPTLTLPPPSDWTPVFIVGVPRSGTTLLAELLARHPGVRNRGELGWLEIVAQRVSRASPSHQSLEDAAALYAAQLRQDDTQARWFIDKQPLNLLHVDLIMSLWPNARIILCTRDARDTALSLWSQSFHDAAHDYAYDFADIAAVIQGCARLGAHWLARYPESIRPVRYEELVEAPDATVAALLSWLGLPASQAKAGPAAAGSIGTASAWQARQPVYTRSAGRWRHYAPHLPELQKLLER